MLASPFVANEGTASRATPPMSSNTPITFSDGNKRSAIKPRNSGAMIAAIGAAPYEAPMMEARPFASRQAPKVTNHAPHRKNCRNIITESRQVINGVFFDMLVVFLRRRPPEEPRHSKAQFPTGCFSGTSFQDCIRARHEKRCG